MRTCSYHCPRCEATLWFMSFKPPFTDVIRCKKCNKRFQLTEKALSDNWMHAFALWAYAISTGLLAISFLIEVELIAALFLSPILGLGALFIAYVLAIPVGKYAAAQIIQNANHEKKYKRVVRREDVGFIDMLMSVFTSSKSSPQVARTPAAYSRRSRRLAAIDEEEENADSPADAETRMESVEQRPLEDDFEDNFEDDFEQHSEDEFEHESDLEDEFGDVPSQLEGENEAEDLLDLDEPSRQFGHPHCGGVTKISGDDFIRVSDPFTIVFNTYCAQCEADVSLSEVYWTDTDESIADYRSRMRSKAPFRFMLIGFLVTPLCGALAGFLLSWWLLFDDFLWNLIFGVFAAFSAGAFVTPYVLRFMGADYTKQR